MGISPSLDVSSLVKLFFLWVGEEKQMEVLDISILSIFSDGLTLSFGFSLSGNGPTITFLDRTPMTSLCTPMYLIEKDLDFSELSSVKDDFPWNVIWVERAGLALKNLFPPFGVFGEYKLSNPGPD